MYEVYLEQTRTIFDSWLKHELAIASFILSLKFQPCEIQEDRMRCVRLQKTVQYKREQVSPTVLLPARIHNILAARMESIGCQQSSRHPKYKNCLHRSIALHSAKTIRFHGAMWLLVDRCHKFPERGQRAYQLIARGSTTSKPSRCKSGFSWRRSTAQSGEVDSGRLQNDGAGDRVRGETEATTMPVAIPSKTLSNDERQQVITPV